MQNTTSRPILFSAPMVIAILAGRKTQTRRILTDQSIITTHADGSPAKAHPRLRIHQPGDQVHNADLRADRAKRERDAIATDLDTIHSDIKALLTETEQEQAMHDTDRHIAFTRRKINFFHKHQELLKPRHEHESGPSAPPTPQSGT